ncbi:DUF4118 domain-containing protein [Saccharomonospora sp. NPDC046836]|uniref:DUF4118 domain-containing protein n=1 Tax=Saccharomonospora sp. NPDC046836 TaxID=3156921 RepID=UPI0033F66743
MHVSRDWIAIASAVVAPVAVSAVLLPLRASLMTTTTTLVLVVVVVAVAALGNRVAGALAALVAAACFDFFFAAPYLHFEITDPVDAQTAVLLLVVGVAVSQLAAHARKQRVIAITGADYLQRIHDALDQARSAGSPNQVVTHVRQQLIDLLNLRECRFELGRLVGHLPRLEQDGSVVAGVRRWEADEPLPQRSIELRAYGDGRFYGRFLLDPVPGAAPSRQARLVAVALADLVGRSYAATGRGGRW